MAKDNSKSLRRYRKWTGFLCLIGLLLAAYSVHVEVSKAKDESYTALCDISEHISCSAVFTSRYGTGFGIVGKIAGDDFLLNLPNGVYGMVMYPVFFLTSLMAYRTVALVELTLGISGVVISIYLGYVLFLKMGDFCVVCIATYIVNFFLFFCSLLNYNLVKSMASDSKQSHNYTSILDGKTKKRV